MNITDIQDSCQIGSELCVIFKTGQQFYGILSEIRETSIVLRLASGNKMPISLDAIATAFSDAYNLAEIQDSKPLTQPISQTEVRSQTLDSVLENASLPATTYESKQTYPIEVLTQAASIAARFEIGTQQASLEPLPIDLTVPKEISSLLYSVKKTKMQGEWDKLRNKYNNAIKNDPSRLKQIARDFEHLSETYTELSAAAKFNLGCLQISLGETSQALQTFQVAAVNHQESRLFYNLAAVALKKNEPEKACYALQSFFQQESLSKHMTVWCKFLALAMRANALSGLDDLLKHVIQNGSRSDTQLILESAVYILKFHNQIDDAYNLIAFTLQGVFEPEQTLAILQSMLSKLYLQPSESYRQQAEQLLEAAQQSQQSQERAKLQRDVTRIIESAKGFGNRGMYSQAIAEIRKALQLAPNDTTLKELEEDYREAQRDKGLPKGDGPYAQARHAKIKIKDFVKAEKLYQEAIKQGDRFDSAVNDLSSLLMQLNRDEEAIELLQKYRHKVSKRETTNNLLADAYKRLGQYKEEITCLQEVLRQTPSDKQNTVLNRIALGSISHAGLSGI
jgi:tetratricopeptide (TPR) repeat protein